MSRFAIIGARSGELLSYGGKVLVHDNRQEIEWLLPRLPGRIVRITDGHLGQPTMRLRDHPGLVHLRWPLRMEDFR